MRVVIWVYTYKNTDKAALARIIGVSSAALVALLGAYISKYIFWGGNEIPMFAAVTFTISIVFGLVVFFWFYREKINELYYK